MSEQPPAASAAAAPATSKAVAAVAASAAAKPADGSTRPRLRFMLASDIHLEFRCPRLELTEDEEAAVFASASFNSEQLERLQNRQQNATTNKNGDGKDKNDDLSSSSPTYRAALLQKARAQIDGIVKMAPPPPPPAGDGDGGEEPCKILALLGDIGLVADQPPDHCGLWLTAFLESSLSRFETTIYVPGNHCFYRGTIEQTHQFFVTFEATHPGRFVYLRVGRDPLDIALPSLPPAAAASDENSVQHVVRIVGCTLWSRTSPASRFVLNDYRQIRVDAKTRFGVDEMHALHERDVAYIKAVETATRHLNEESAEHQQQQEGQKRVRYHLAVMTHHLPVTSPTPAIAPCEEDNEYMYNINGTALITGDGKGVFSNADGTGPLEMWCFGHSHQSCDFVFDGCRLLSSQMGYPQHHGTGLYREWDQHRVFEF
jgi:hypothetical protein